MVQWLNHTQKQTFKVSYVFVKVSTQCFACARSRKVLGNIFDKLFFANHNDFDYDKIIKRVKKGKVKLIEIQRSRGYSHRKSLSIAKIEKVVNIKAKFF